MVAWISKGQSLTLTNDFRSSCVEIGAARRPPVTDIWTFTQTNLYTGDIQVNLRPTTEKASFLRLF